MTTLFLFAHQDDEIGVFHEMTRAIKRGEDVYCLYLTNGAFKGVSPKRRNDESLKVLKSFGVAPERIIFLGERLDIADGHLVENLERCFLALQEIVEKIRAETGSIDRLIMHAFEGGHQDHDSVYLCGVALAKALGIVNNSFQFPLYRMPAGRFLLSFAKPLAQNGRVIASHIPVMARINHLLQMRHYHSQRRVMLKIGLHMAWHYLTNGQAYLQAIKSSRVYEEANSGIMLYEYWKLYSQAAFKEQSAPFIKHAIDGLDDDR